MKSPVVKRSVVVGGHKTSVSLEEAFWNCMKEISKEHRITVSELVGRIDTNRQQGNLSSGIRLFVLDHFQNRSAGLTGGTQPHSSQGPAHSDSP
jgi:predicted DNA-binding ribbon-helix-helix protein